MERAISYALFGLGVVGAVLWLTAVRRRMRLRRRAQQLNLGVEAVGLADLQLLRDIHSVVVYLGVAAMGALLLLLDAPRDLLATVALVPAAVLTLYMAAKGRWEQTAALHRLDVEQRAEQALDQDFAAPRQLANLLIPTEVPEVEGVEVGVRHLSGEGLAGGDFAEVLPLPGGRTAFLVGDVAGHGLDPALTALRVKELLRAQLRRFRDPAQALEELNLQLAAETRPEELVSAAVVVVDPEAGTLRHASAGHPAVFCHLGRDVRLMRATGPLLFLDITGGWSSREVSFQPGEVAVLVTDGLLEARNGRQFLGEERVASLIRREVTEAAPRLAGILADAAVDFAGGRPQDDLTVVVIRRSA